MKRQTKRLVALTGLLLIAGTIIIGAFVAIRQADPLAQARRAGNTVVVEAMGSYSELTQEQMTSESDLIVIGRVVAISDSRWNQDSGEYWTPSDDETLLPVHTLTVAVTQVLRGRTESDQLTITVIGNSPNSQAITSAENPVVVGGKPDHQLGANSQGVFYLRRTELAWKGGTVPAVMFTAHPDYSFLRQTSESSFYSLQADKTFALDDLINLGIID